MICIIIPIYNENDNIFRLISSLKKLNLNALFVVVDDSKTPIKKLYKIKNVSYLFRGKKLGRGSAVLFAIKKFINNKRIKFFLEMDADFSHNPNEIVRNLKYFSKKKLNFLISSRYIKNSKIINWPISRIILSKLANLLARILLGVPIMDYTNGFRIYDTNAARHILKTCKNSGQGFIILSEIIFELYYNGFKIDEINTIFLNRTRGQSKANFMEIISAFIGIWKIFFTKRLFNNYKI